MKILKKVNFLFIFFNNILIGSELEMDFHLVIIETNFQSSKNNNNYYNNQQGVIIKNYVI